MKINIIVNCQKIQNAPSWDSFNVENFNNIIFVPHFFPTTMYLIEATLCFKDPALFILYVFNGWSIKASFVFLVPSEATL